MLICGLVSAGIGFALGIVLYRAISPNWSVAAVIAGTWLWYLSTLGLVLFESSGGAKADRERLYTPMQGPAMQTSGQRWISKPELPEVAQPKLVRTRTLCVCVCVCCVTLTLDPLRLRFCSTTPSRRRRSLAATRWRRR